MSSYPAFQLTSEYQLISPLLPQLSLQFTTQPHHSRPHHVHSDLSLGSSPPISVSKLAKTPKYIDPHLVPASLEKLGSTDEALHWAKMQRRPLLICNSPNRRRSKMLTPIHLLLISSKTQSYSYSSPQIIPSSTVSTTDIRNLLRVTYGGELKLPFQVGLAPSQIRPP